MSTRTTHKDFIRPEDDRPEKGPVYAINTSKARVVFERRENIPGVNFGPAGTADSVRQIDIRMLDIVEFLRLWSNGVLAVSTSSKVAEKYTSLELDRKIAKAEAENDILASITSRDESKDYVVETDKRGTPEVKRTNTRKTNKGAETKADDAKDADK